MYCRKAKKNNREGQASARMTTIMHGSKHETETAAEEKQATNCIQMGNGTIPSISAGDSETLQLSIHPESSAFSLGRVSAGAADLHRGYRIQVEQIKVGGHVVSVIAARGVIKVRLENKRKPVPAAKICATVQMYACLRNHPTQRPSTKAFERAQQRIQSSCSHS